MVQKLQALMRKMYTSFYKCNRIVNNNTEYKDALKTAWRKDTQNKVIQHKNLGNETQHNHT
jgi:hypothetical protein